MEGLGYRYEHLSKLELRERLGYRYEHCFRADGDLITKNSRIIDGYEPCLEKKVYFFEIKTNFTIKTRGMGSEIRQRMGSEIHRTCMYDRDGEMYLRDWMSFKLDAYWMPEGRIEYLVCQAFDFAKRCSVADDARLVIPVAVDLDICTVQLATEEVGEAFARAIRPAEFSTNLPRIREFADLKLPKIRVEVEDVDRWSSLMKTCPVCLCKTTLGAQICVLPCGHPFHYYCLPCYWLVSDNSFCPTCRVPVRTS